MVVVGEQAPTVGASPLMMMRRRIYCRNMAREEGGCWGG